MPINSIRFILFITPSFAFYMLYINTSSEPTSTPTHSNHKRLLIMFFTSSQWWQKKNHHPASLLKTCVPTVPPSFKHFQPFFLVLSVMLYTTSTVDMLTYILYYYEFRFLIHFSKKEHNTRIVVYKIALVVILRVYSSLF